MTFSSIEELIQVRPTDPGHSRSLGGPRRASERRMTSLLLAAATFLALHVVVSGTRLRDAIVGAIGDSLYRGLFALASLATIVWMARAYAAAPGLPLWQAPRSLHWLAVLLGLPAALLVAVGLTTPNPTTTGAESLLAEGVPVRGIVRVTRHPFLAGVAIWAFAHLLVNGDTASIVLFGTLLSLALLGPRLIDAKAGTRVWRTVGGLRGADVGAPVCRHRGRPQPLRRPRDRHLAAPARRRRLRGTPRGPPLADRRAGAATIGREITA